MHWSVAFGRKPDGSIAKTPKDANGKVILDKKLCDDPLPTWKAMEEMVNKGLCKHIGISNFNIRRSEQLLKGAKIKPVCNQVELNFSNPQPELLRWSKEAGILLESYSPLGSTGAKERDHPEVGAPLYSDR
jgi:diketogulonate reductase-like aldo/keto reductase